MTVLFVVWLLRRFFQEMAFCYRNHITSLFFPLPVFQYYRVLFCFQFFWFCSIRGLRWLCPFREAVLSFPSSGTLPSLQYYCFPIVVWLFPYHGSSIFRFWKLRLHIPVITYQNNLLFVHIYTFYIFVNITCIWRCHCSHFARRKIKVMRVLVSLK